MKFNSKNFGEFDKKPTNFETPYIYKKAVSDDVIQKIHDMVYDNNIPFEKGITGSKEVYTDATYSNNRDIAYIDSTDYSHWLYSFLEGAVRGANEELYQFDIDRVTDPIHYVIYPEPNTIGKTGEKREEGGYLHWHQDIGFEEVNSRKLATIVFLSDRRDYEGGELQIWCGGEGYDVMDLDKGDVVVFPTFLMHRLTPVTKGERRALVYWTGGKPFR